MPLFNKRLLKATLKEKLSAEPITKATKVGSNSTKLSFKTVQSLSVSLALTIFDTASSTSF